MGKAVTRANWWSKAVLLALPAAVAMGVPRVAAASESFPGAVLSYVQRKNPDVVCPVPCLLCHYVSEGGKGTARNEGFIENLRNVAAVRESEPATIGPALAALEANVDCPTAPGAPCDSDRDGRTDIQELYESRDPDGSRDFDACIKYGCGATVAPRRSVRTELAPLWLLVAVGLVAAARRARP